MSEQLPAAEPMSSSTKTWRQTDGRTDEFNRSQGGETARILEELENVKSVLTCWSLYNAVKYPSLCTLYCVCQLMCVCVCGCAHLWSVGFQQKHQKRQHRQAFSSKTHCADAKPEQTGESLVRFPFHSIRSVCTCTLQRRHADYQGNPWSVWLKT